MPVQKFRSVADMPEAGFRAPLDPRNLVLACELSTLAMRLAPRRFPPGVYRHRSVEAAAEARERWERAFTATPAEGRSKGAGSEDRRE